MPVASRDTRSQISFFSSLGGSVMGLPRVKSKTLSAPCSFFSLSPSSNIALIHEELSMSLDIRFEITILYLPM
jgi:hypothetical protein